MSAVIFNYDEFKDLAKIGGLDQVEKQFDKDVLGNKSLVNKIGDISKITFEQKKLVLYGESSYITHTFYTKLNKKNQIYGLISTPAIGIQGTINLVRPESSLKFYVINSKYVDHILLQLEDIRKPRKIEAKDAKVRHFSILSTKP